MAIKKYAFLALALLSSVVKADEDRCYKFYVGGDLGMGVFAVDRNTSVTGNFVTTPNADDTNFGNWCGSLGGPAFIGGARLGLAWDGSECWYAAVEGNIHYVGLKERTREYSDLGIGLNDGALDFYKPDVRGCVNTDFMAGVNVHLGYKLCDCDSVIYVLGGYKYLKRNAYLNIGAYKDAEGTTAWEDITLRSCGGSNNGWTVGLGGLMNLRCDWDFRLEAAYAQFGRRCNRLSADVDTDSTANPTFKFNINDNSRAQLFYGLASLGYNF